LLKSADLPFVVAVTKMLSRKEALQIPEAMEAMKKEYARLAARCWNERDRRSKDDVIREAREEGR
jgi:electron transfer flavoprotein alpha/beta subunit